MPQAKLARVGGSSRSILRRQTKEKVKMRTRLLVLVAQCCICTLSIGSAAAAGQTADGPGTTPAGNAVALHVSTVGGDLTAAQSGSVTTPESKTCPISLSLEIKSAAHGKIGRASCRERV